MATSYVMMGAASELKTAYQRDQYRANTYAWVPALVVATDAGGSAVVGGFWTWVVGGGASAALGGWAGRNWDRISSILTANEAAKPPSDTIPIDETKWSGDHQNIKGQSGAGASDNTRIGPTGEVWVQQPGGSWVNTGNANDMVGGSRASGRNGKDREPSWKEDRGRKQRGDW
jgi:hypothetical protein